MGFREVSAPAPGVLPPPPSSLLLMSAEWLISHILFPFLLLLYSSFYSFLNTIFKRHNHCCLALASSVTILKLAGIGSIRHGGSFLQLLTEVTPVAFLLPNPCHVNTIQLYAFWFNIPCWLRVPIKKSLFMAFKSRVDILIFFFFTKHGLICGFFYSSIWQSNLNTESCQK